MISRVRIIEPITDQYGFHWLVLPGGWYHQHVQTMDLDVRGLAVGIGPGNLNGELLNLAVNTSTARKDVNHF